MSDSVSVQLPVRGRPVTVAGSPYTTETSKQIAQVLSLSPRTVEMHVNGALAALGCKTRAEATHRAALAGLL